MVHYCSGSNLVGNIELEDVPLRKDALRSLKLPLEIKDGRFDLGRLCPTIQLVCIPLCCARFIVLPVW